MLQTIGAFNVFKLIRPSLSVLWKILAKVLQLKCADVLSVVLEITATVPLANIVQFNLEVLVELV
jgi:hypothetical protein